MFNKRIYEAMQDAYLQGYVSRTDWVDYCQWILLRIMGKR
jgi:hypothetical protein